LCRVTIKLVRETIKSMSKKKNKASVNLWSVIVQETKQVIEADQVFESYSVPEKVLAFYYTLIELLKPSRRKIITQFDDMWFWQLWPEELDMMKEPFEEYMFQLIGEGVQQREVADRPVITGYYHHVLWYQLMFVVRFWVRDKSDECGNTDAVIEKAVRLSFDLMGYNTIDSLFDLTKFVVKRW